ncbi:MAG: hypothetical protein J0I47_03095 [Sphingomonas sp.]|uniref:hypothetical protein n=1 Tax=Sphingomonas sp. TaxID=28214 RepID=UPI001AC0BDE6|nr:hypothetical protein [Sphingomonas sp.]MBN8807213.1 hypothetical protein [Sphingomonas sp.]
MIAGLLFATAEASDRHDALAATLPIGGVTLVEFQARLLIAAGATQIVVVVSRMTPELLGAVNRIGRRGIAIDTVRTPGEAIAKLHPLARVVWLADGLVTTGAVVEAMAARDHDTLLVSAKGEGLERVGPDAVWAGIATIDAQRIADVARLPTDYDFASALLRTAAQRGAEHVTLPDSAARAGHGIERDSRMLAAKGRAALIAALGERANWVDRYLIAPLAKAVLPPLIARSVPAFVMVAIATAAALVGLVALALRWSVTGLVFTIVALALFALGDTLGWLRDEGRLRTAVRWAGPGVVGASVLAFGWQASAEATTAMVLAIALVIAAALAERAASAVARRLWWAVPAAYPLILLVAAILGRPAIGLVAAGLYAAATLGTAIERLRARLAGATG